jgi:hypothetical protein
MNGGRVLYVAEYSGKSEYRIRLRKAKNDWAEMFYFDARTGTVRLGRDRRFILSMQQGKLVNGMKLVVRPFRGGNEQRQKYVTGAFNNFHNYGTQSMCIDVAGFKDVDRAEVIFYKPCHKGKNQMWSLIYQSG